MSNNSSLPLTIEEAEGVGLNLKTNIQKAKIWEGEFHLPKY